MGILDNAKDVAELIKKYNDQELYQKIIDLRDEIFSLKEENLAQKERIKILEDELSIKNNLIYDKPYYWLKDSDSKDGPFCQKCWDADKKLIRLQGRSNDIWKCHQCKGIFEGPGYSLHRF